MLARILARFVILLVVTLVTVSDLPGLAPLSLGGLFSTSAAMAQERDTSRKPPTRRSEALTVRAYEIIVEVQTAMDESRIGDAIALLNQIIETGDKFKPFDIATAYRYRGYLSASEDNYAGAVSDFEAALKLGVLNENDALDLRYYLAQVYLADDQPLKAISNLEIWFASAENPAASAYFFAAQAHGVIEQYTQALPYAETGLAKMEAAGDRREKWYALTAALYVRADRYQDAVAPMETLLNYWPAKAVYFDQLGAVYQTLGRDREAFAILALKYVNGLATKEDEILRLAQLYRFYGYPYKGAYILAQEMASGHVKRSWKNERELGETWIQAREHERALPPLTNAARASSDGEIWLRLCNTYVENEKWRESSQACPNAVRKGLNDKDRGIGEMLSAIALYELFKVERKSDPDSDLRTKALDFFESCAESKVIGDDCAQWIEFIETEKDSERSAVVLRQKGESDLETRILERLKKIQQAEQLSGQ